ncbi:pseudouridylate synthase TRUB2, mitochondrial isoform X2 [Halyomorpha halys]|uniref:pseudouridylate synthase TRUB2, mitochondrial isoform X1 n=1 Tax=Halyomorpha halys TaxID=286706 RepID=UPI0006D4EE66|nr:mitochondrial mRNA pseudouridine synthase Trub2 isoform X1 [Halyomorpha halys]XP_014283507.1 mitochondrial mRNA pseudouridine synthase Trub2 isoform X2 [Halyomorpha halys]
MRTALLYDAQSVSQLLNGIVCVYKSAGETFNRVRQSFLHKLSKELCELECRIPKQRISVERDEVTRILTVKKFENLADHPLVMGPMYEPNDFKCSSAVRLGIDTAGVLVLGLNSGTKDVYELHREHPLRVYRLNGTFGYMTNNLYKTGKVVDKSSFQHIRRGALEKFLAATEASHQRTMYELCGVDPQSQAAYELAAKGLIRPTNTKAPVIYAVKFISLELPNFTIEVHCINEYEAYLKALINSIGTRLQSYATCTGIQCMRHSHFSLEHALLKKHWNLEEVIKNIQNNKRLMKMHGSLEGGLLQAVS